MGKAGGGAMLYFYSLAISWALPMSDSGAKGVQNLPTYRTFNLIAPVPVLNFVSACNLNVSFHVLTLSAMQSCT